MDHSRDRLEENNIKEEQDEKKIQKTLIDIKRKYGKNAILKGMNLEEGATDNEKITIT